MTRPASQKTPIGINSLLKERLPQTAKANFLQLRVNHFSMSSHAFRVCKLSIQLCLLPLLPPVFQTLFAGFSSSLRDWITWIKNFISVHIMNIGIQHFLSIVFKTKFVIHPWKRKIKILKYILPFCCK